MLNKYDIYERATRLVGTRGRIGIIPFVPEQIEQVSLKLHLGNWFATARKTRLQSFKLGDLNSEQLLATLGREESFVQDNESFLIHPGDLVLGVSREFIALPLDIKAYVEGKSRIGRTGLIIATASKVDPGFHGAIVLELANAGTVPLEIFPGRLVGQLVFHFVSRELPEGDFYDGEFYCQIKP